MARWRSTAARADGAGSGFPRVAVRAWILAPLLLAYWRAHQKPWNYGPMLVDADSHAPSVNPSRYNFADIASMGVVIRDENIGFRHLGTPRTPSTPRASANKTAE